MNIEFSIGTYDKIQHEFVQNWLTDNKFEVKDISFNGDHYSEIYCFGDYNKAYRKLSGIANISLEHWN